MAALPDPDLYREYEELFDADVMEKILCDQGFSKEIRKKLSAYKRKRNHANRVVVPYYYAKGCGEQKIGRVFAKNYGGLQAFPRDIRDTLTAKFYWDLDMENAHYWIMRNFCEKNGLKHTSIAYYCDHREECLRAVSANRDLAKTAFLKIAYGGNIKLSDVNLEDDGEEPEGDITLIQEIEKDIANVIPFVKGKYPNIYKIAKEMCRRKKEWADKKGKKIYWNADYSTLALVLQTEEHNCLEAIENYLVENDRQMDMPIHDGGRVRKLDNETHFPNDLIRGAENHVANILGYKIKLKIKPLPTYNPTKNSPTEVIDDEYAARFFVGLMLDNMIRSYNDIYIYDENIGMWECSDRSFRCAVMKYKSQLIFTKVDEKGNTTTYNYGGCEKNIASMRKWIASNYNESTPIDDSKSKHCLLFLNGWFDMITQTFHNGFDGCRDKYFTKRINRNFNPIRNNALEKQLKTIFFENPYNDSEVGPCYMNGIARAIAGCCDKAWWCIVGRPDCGKGVMTQALSTVFDEYVGEFNPNVLKINLRDGSDEAKKMAWYAPLVGCRIAIGNEVRIDGKPLDGNQIKSLSSGGDSIMFRKNFQDQVKVVPVTTFFNFMNDMPPVSPCDQALKNRMNCIPHTKSFVNKPQSECNEYEMQGDPLLKEKIKHIDWINALFWLLMDAYNGGKMLEKPSAVVAEIDELFVVEDCKIKELLEEKYEFVPTSDEDSYVTSRDIITYLTQQGIRMSETKIGRELKSLGLKKKDIKIDRKTTRVWFGLRE